MNFYILDWFHVTLCVECVDSKEKQRQKAKKSWEKASEFYVNGVTEELYEIARRLSKVEGEEVLSWFYFGGFRGNNSSMAELRTISGKIICQVNVLRFGSVADGNIHKGAVVEMPQTSLQCFNRALFDILIQKGKVSNISFQAL